MRVSWEIEQPAVDGQPQSRKSYTGSAPASRNDPTSRALAVPVSFAAPTRTFAPFKPLMIEAHAVVLPESIAEPTTSTSAGEASDLEEGPIANDRRFTGRSALNA